MFKEEKAQFMRQLLNFLAIKKNNFLKESLLLN
jgi:hypothetical protein